MRIRHLTVVLATAGALAAAATAATPAFAASHAPAHGKPTTTPVHGKPSTTPSKKPTSKPFAVTGTLTAADPVAQTVTVAVNGGNTARGTSLTVTVATTARITLDDAGQPAFAAGECRKNGSGAETVVGGSVLSGRS